MSIREEIQQLPMDAVALRKFGLLVGAVFAAAGAFFFWYKGFQWGMVLLVIGAPLILLGAVAPKALRPVYLAWMSMAVVLGFFVTRVLLTIFFFLVITPVGLFFKVIGRDALHRKLDRDGPTYWIEKEYAIADRSRLEKFF
ncbi:MAG: SxtJ family membrane protein [Acidobacteriota bacterium]